MSQWFKKTFFTDLDNYPDEMKISIPQRGWFNKLWHFMGPGLLIGIAYIDPGNIDADINAGATEKYSLIWAMFVCTFMGFILQILSAKLGIYTDMDLAYACRAAYSKYIRYILWVIAELSVIMSDIPEIIGTATAFNLLFGTRMWVGVIITVFSTFIFLGFQYFGIRYVELIMAIFIGTISACFFVEMILSKPSALEVLDGFIPRVLNAKAFFIITTLMGSIVMPHNLFLHSALVKSRKIELNNKAKQEAVFFNIIESGFSIFISFFINVSVIILSGCKFYGKYEDAGLMSASKLLETVFNGRWAAIVFAIGLLASGQSSTITGTYAGQFIMEGFLNLRVKMFYRNLITRCVAILPSLAFAFSNVETTDSLVLISSSILSLQLPFVLIPLIKFTSSEKLMTKNFVNSMFFTNSSWFMAFLASVCNTVFVSVQVYNVIHNMHAFRLITKVFLLSAIFISTSLYLAFLVYLVYLPINIDNDEYTRSNLLNNTQDTVPSLTFGPDVSPRTLN